MEILLRMLASRFPLQTLKFLRAWWIKSCTRSQSSRRKMGAHFTSRQTQTLLKTSGCKLFALLRQLGRRVKILRHVWYNDKIWSFKTTCVGLIHLVSLYVWLKMKYCLSHIVQPKRRNNPNRKQCMRHDENILFYTWVWKTQKLCLIQYNLPCLNI